MNNQPEPAGNILSIAFLHLAPVPGDIAGNRKRIEAAIQLAAEQGAQWMLTPECGVCGFTFAAEAGTDWILPQPDDWMSGVCGLAAKLKITLFLNHPERDAASGLLHNSIFVIGPDGAILGRHRKINALKIGSEAWSSPGQTAVPVNVPPVGPVGLLVCADAYTPGICKALADQGARMLVSAASWAPGFHGPENVWETCTRITGLTLLVCNRTGRDRVLDFSGAESVVAHGGRRLLSFHSESAALMLLNWELDAAQPRDPEPLVIPL